MIQFQVPIHICAFFFLNLALKKSQKHVSRRPGNFAGPKTSRVSRESTSGALFLKFLESFRMRKAIAKSRPLLLQGFFIHIFLIWTDISFKQEVSSVYTSSFLDTDQLKMALRAWKVSEAFDKRAWGPKRQLII